MKGPVFKLLLHIVRVGWQGREQAIHDSATIVGSNTGNEIELGGMCVESRIEQTRLGTAR